MTIGNTVALRSVAAGPVGRGYLLRYRALAFSTATLLIVLVFAGLPLQFLDHAPELANVVGTVHGFLYLVYLFVAFQLARRVQVPKLKMLLVLLAGTIPFCAFVAERYLTRRFVTLVGAEAGAETSVSAPGAGWRRRWLGRRALMLHLEVVLIAPACAAAGWWQATRALSGNGLSWVYSIEWPLFAVLAIVGWWYLVHEDPAAYAARKARPLPAVTSEPLPARRATVERFTARLASALAILVVIEFGLGVGTLVLVPPGRPTGWVPSDGGAGLYVLHASLALPLVLGGILLIRRVAGRSRMARLSGWIGAVGVAVAGIGGLLCAPHALRILGIGVMFLGAVVAGFGYLLPAFERLER